MLVRLWACRHMQEDLAAINQWGESSLTPWEKRRADPTYKRSDETLCFKVTCALCASLRRQLTYSFTCYHRYVPLLGMGRLPASRPTVTWYKPFFLFHDGKCSQISCCSFSSFVAIFSNFRPVWWLFICKKVSRYKLGDFWINMSPRANICIMML